MSQFEVILTSRSRVSFSELIMMNYYFFSSADQALSFTPISFDSAALYSERSTRHLITCFLNAKFSWTGSYHNSFSWRRWTQKSRGVLFLGPERRRDIGIRSITQVIPDHGFSSR